MQTTKACIQRILKRAGLYYRLKASSVYTFYWWFSDRSMVERGHRELNFYRELLCGFCKGALIFDIGANQGTKTAVFLTLGANVVAVEPDVTNQNVLKQKFLTYRLARRPVVIVGKAVSDKESVETMWIDEAGSAKNTLSSKWVETLRTDEERFGHSLTFAQQAKVETVTLKQLVNEHGDPFFIKVDVEGSELSVLRGLHRPVPYLSFEVNLPEFLQEGLKCVQLLGSMAADGMFNYVVDCQQGLELQEWVGPREFSALLPHCPDRSIEVFWKTIPD
ncbi:MAG TPA: FkbM family methyltransferase [Terriglobia bacterium]|nr:FkbM family methyltransferase [Terriglobia bacterium]